MNIPLSDYVLAVLFFVSSIYELRCAFKYGAMAFLPLEIAKVESTEFPRLFKLLVVLTAMLAVGSFLWIVFLILAKYSIYF